MDWKASERGGRVKGIGLSLPNRGVLFGATDVEGLFRSTEVAEASGYFTSVWVGDGLIAKPRLEAVTLLAAIAARTRKLRLGVCCMATFPLRNPVLFGCQWATLDALSNGRSLLAVCLGAPTGRGGGDFAAELRAMDVRATERVGRLEEGIAALRTLWGGRSDFQGKYWSWPEIDLEPKPVQTPPPIWIASNPDPSKLAEVRYERAIRRVARLADGWLSTVVTPTEFNRRWNEIKDAARAENRPPERMTSAVHLMINLNNDEERARSEAKAFLDRYYSTDVKPDTMDVWGAYGPPKLVLDRIGEYIDAGVELPILRFASFDQDGQIDRALEDLLPKIIAL
jgi:alkanesulfonate monooxygenase SsuD/methylene tetrahydromethanopterin reductase-like flavin-dependent oxidoreductase (luciferase family)